MNGLKLSVVMPNYNYGHYIGEALDAILNQSYPPDELIIVDDCSTDDSVAVIESCIKDHPNARLLKNEKNMGFLYTMNRTLMEARGDYMHSTASDDIVLPGFYEKSMNLLMKYPRTGLSCCDTRLLYDNNKILEKKLYLSRSNSCFTPSEAEKIFLKEMITPILSNTVIVKRSALVEAGGYLPQMKWACDLFSNNVISFRYGFCYIPEILAVTRVHGHQYGSSMFGKWHLDREVIENIIVTVKKPEYSDVLPFFKRTAGFSQSPFEVFRVVAGKREYWDFLSFKLLKFALYDLIKRTLFVFLHPKAKDRMRDMVYKLRQYKHYVRSKRRGIE